MVELFKYELSHWYPHMKPRDIEIWERFIQAYPDAYTQCQYDFHVGDAPEFDTAVEGIDNANQHMLYQLKIDVVGYKSSGIDIIEVKPDAGPSSIGQVQGYRTLYVRDEKPTQNVGVVIVSNVEKPNMRYLCAQAGVSLFIV